MVSDKTATISVKVVGRLMADEEGGRGQTMSPRVAKRGDGRADGEEGTLERVDRHVERVGRCLCTCVADPWARESRSDAQERRKGALDSRRHGDGG